MRDETMERERQRKIKKSKDLVKGSAKAKAGCRYKKKRVCSPIKGVGKLRSLRKRQGNGEKPALAIRNRLHRLQDLPADLRRRLVELERADERREDDLELEHR